MTGRHGKRSHADNRQHRRVKKNLKKRILDVDQVIDNVQRDFKPERDEELPGSGEFYCNFCCRHFANAKILEDHKTSKPHKRTVKRVEQESTDIYTQKSAEFFAGMTTSTSPSVSDMN